MKPNFDFTKHRKFGVISTLLIVLGFVYTFAFNDGFNLGIDFKAGLSQQIKIEADTQVERQDVLGTLESIKGVQVQVIGAKAENRFVVKAQDSGEDNFKTEVTSAIKSLLEGTYGTNNVTVTSTEFIGGSFSSNLTSEVIFMTTLALVLILAYVWFRFHLNYAISAIAAIFHDVAFLLAFIGVTGLEVNTSTIAALLTIIGYSLNDTIVIFDRIRENDKFVKNKTYEEKVNLSLNESLSRTIITSVTTLIAVTAIAIFADGQIQQFAYSLIVGIVVGTYSSIFIASSVALGWNNKIASKRKEKYKKETANISVVK